MLFVDSPNPSNLQLKHQASDQALELGNPHRLLAALLLRLKQLRRLFEKAVLLPLSTARTCSALKSAENLRRLRMSVLLSW